MKELSDKAYNAYLTLKNNSYMDDTDEEVQKVCKEIARYLKEKLR